MGLHRTDLVSTVERADVGGLVYGAVVGGGALAAISAHSDETPRVALATLLVAVVCWLSHVYVHVLKSDLPAMVVHVGARCRAVDGRSVRAAHDRAQGVPALSSADRRRRPSAEKK